MFHIVLFQPEIPPNTGNAIRLCANTGSTLHLVKPLGFDLYHKNARRAGLDYDDLATVRLHQGLDACLEALGGARLFSVETSGTRVYSEARFQTGDALIFGKESVGLSEELLARWAEVVDESGYQVERSTADSVAFREALISAQAERSEPGISS